MSEGAWPDPRVILGSGKCPSGLLVASHWGQKQRQAVAPDPFPVLLAHPAGALLPGSPGGPWGRTLFRRCTEPRAWEPVQEAASTICDIFVFSNTQK